jgi:septal ring factor EnvC (AmiA/AmiB activator)
MKRALAVVATLVFTLLAAGGAAFADTPAPDGAVNADRARLNTEWSKLKEQMTNLRSKVGDYTKQIGALVDPKTTRDKVAGLQADISEALAETAENGAIAALAQKILDTDKGWLADIYKHGWTLDRVAGLESKFKATIDKTEHTIEDIARVRRELAATLKRVQNDGDYLEALARADESEEMSRVLESLLRDLQSTSDNLKGLVDEGPGV